MNTSKLSRALCIKVLAMAIIAVASALFSLSARAQNQSVFSYESDAAYNAFHSAFLVQSNGATYYGNTLTDHSEAFLWGQASDIFIDEDYWDQKHNPATATLITNLLNRFESTNGTDWSWDSWNDDMEWAILAFERGYEVTGNSSYLTIAENNWNEVYNRGWDTSYGGGGIWENMANFDAGNTSADKCALSNSPFVIAGCALYADTNNSTYLNESEADYSWEWNNIYNHTSSANSFGGSGQVNEGVKWTIGQTNSGYLESSDNIYNDGCFLEAANCLHQVTQNNNYYNDETRTINHVVNEGPVMSYNGSPGNPQYQYWFSKGLSHYCTDNNQWPTYYLWLLGNANSAWRNRDSSNLTEDDWVDANTNSNPAALNAGSAVAIWSALDIPQQSQLVNNYSGLAMDLISGNTGVNAPINQWAVSNYLDANQHWTLYPTSSGSDALISADTDCGAAISAASKSNSAALLDYPFANGDTSMQYNVISEGNGLYQIQNVNSGLALDDSGYGTSNGSQIIQYTYGGGANQLWKITPFASFTGNYQIQNVNSGLALDVNGNSTSNGASVIQWPYGGGANQKWTFVATNNGYYQIKNVNSGLDLAVLNASFFTGSNIVQYAFGSAGNDQWLPVQNADGSWTFYNLNSGLVLDDPANSTSQGTEFDQWVTNGGNSNQKFKLIAE